MSRNSNLIADVQIDERMPVTVELTAQNPAFATFLPHNLRSRLRAKQGLAEQKWLNHDGRLLRFRKTIRADLCDQYFRQSRPAHISCVDPCHTIHQYSA